MGGSHFRNINLIIKNTVAKMKGISKQQLILCSIFLYLNVIKAKFFPINTDECGRTKGCYRMPEDCNGKNCISLVTFKRDNRSVSFEMQSQVSGDLPWIALGFSKEPKMV